MSLEQTLQEFEQHLSASADDSKIDTTLKKLVSFTDPIPLPGQGQTYQRWQLLAQVAATHLGLAKCFESHLDAISILKELNFNPVPLGLYAIWAAEGPQSVIEYENGICNGQKAWCSAADIVDYGLITYRDSNKEPYLLLVDMHQAGIKTDLSHWKAVGMHSTETARISLENVKAQQVGEAGDYLNRPGFWHGAAGVAACWYGATVRLASFLADSCQQRPQPFHLYYLGQINTQLACTKSFFMFVAEQIDQHPTKTHEYIIRLLRAKVEETALFVLELVGKALGARPFCENPVFANLAADLPVFLRQSHAAFDLENIGKIACKEQDTWQL